MPRTEITSEFLDQMVRESSFQTSTVWVHRTVSGHYLIGNIVDGEPQGGVRLARSAQRAFVYIKEIGDRYAS